MAIEISSKTEIKKKLWKIAFISFSVFLFLILFLSYFFINYISEKRSKDIENKKQILVKTISEKQLEQRLVLDESKIDVFKNLFLEHKKPLNVFTLLEKIIHPNVWISEFSFDSIENVIFFSGQARDFMDLGQQLLIFKEQQNFEQVDLTDISMNDEGKIKFFIKINLDSEILK